MKCENCGNDVSRRALFCSNCGTKINDNYMAANEAIVNTVSRVNIKVLRIICVLVTFILAIGLVVLINHAYEIRYRYNSENSSSYANEHMDEFLEIINNADHYEISRFYNRNNIYFSYNENQEKYNEIERGAYSFCVIMNHAMMYCFEDEKPVYDETENIARNIHSIYSYYDEVSSLPEESVARKYYDRLVQDTEMILKVYYKLDDDIVSSLHEMSNAEIAIIIAEAESRIYGN